MKKYLRFLTPVILIAGVMAGFTACNKSGNGNGADNNYKYDGKGYALDRAKVFWNGGKGNYVFEPQGHIPHSGCTVADIMFYNLYVGTLQLQVCSPNADIVGTYRWLPGWGSGQTFEDDWSFSYTILLGGPYLLQYGLGYDSLENGELRITRDAVGNYKFDIEGISSEGKAVEFLYSGHLEEVDTVEEIFKLM